MTKRIVGWLVLLPLCVVLIVFAIANRQLVVVNFNPFAPVETLSAPGFGVPLFLVVYAVLLIGVLLGGVATWFTQGHHRQDKRRYRRESERLHRDLEDARRSPPEPVPALGADDYLTR